MQRTSQTTLAADIKIIGTMKEEYKEILTEDALDFIAKLQFKFNDRRRALLYARAERQKTLDEGSKPTFLEETKEIRESDWTVAPIPEDLQDRRVEITGPVNRKMIINALNSGANVFMADFEDANAPTWDNNLEGQINLRDAVNKTISYTNPKNNKFYQLNEQTATLLVRPRGWHLVDKNIQINGEAVSGSLMDFGLYFFHNAKTLLANGSGPYFYLPKLESHKEARLWNDIFVFAQEELGIPQGSVKATVLIETILAAFEMDEILYELKEHSAGLNCGRWDYIFSYIKKFRNHPGFILPDRSQVTMSVPFMKSYYELLIKTCHRRNIHAMGGMAAQIPIKNDEEANTKAIAKVAADKEREAKAGHDGTWVAHPGLVATAREVFDRYMPNKNQLEKQRPEINIDAKDLIAVPAGSITKEGMINNIDVAIQYIEAWLNGNGAVPIYNLMEDAATAEISRAQLWQWIKHNARLDDGTPITAELYDSMKPEVRNRIKTLVGEERYMQGKYAIAEEILDRLVLSQEFEEFLTLPAYEQL
ncbi:malate synthase A [Algivirga pacifica]|uniref:Malate synthase n=1 Tax=Algivirga pacifica TaxID=1162670 RepID=A0ABP9D968_9BACT